LGHAIGQHGLCHLSAKTLPPKGLSKAIPKIHLALSETKSTPAHQCSSGFGFHGPGDPTPLSCLLAHVVNKYSRLGSRVHGPIANNPHLVWVGANVRVCRDISLRPPAYNHTSRFQYHSTIL